LPGVAGRLMRLRLGWWLCANRRVDIMDLVDNSMDNMDNMNDVD
jgi:hypothetical protein